MIRHISAVGITALAVGLVPLAAAQAASAQGASAPAAKPLPNPCHTFTARSADALLQVSSRTHLSEKLGSNKNPAGLTCTIQHGKTRLFVEVSRQEGGTGSEENCYPSPKLGRDSLLCVSNAKSPAFSFALFHKDGLWVSDSINVRVPDKGQRLYEFALPQYKSFKA
jgi:hypothetical protein